MTNLCQRIGDGMLQVARLPVVKPRYCSLRWRCDDVFLGYPRHRHLWLSEQLSLRAPRLSDAARRFLPRLGPLKRAASLCDYAAGGLPAYFRPTYALRSTAGEICSAASERGILYPNADGR
jgi:hypothetical protein